MSIQRQHVYIARSSWGHTRPQLNLALNILASQPDLKITFIGNIENLSKCRAELIRHGTYGSRLDLILLGELAEGVTSWAKSTKGEVIIAEQFHGVYRNLLQGEKATEGFDKGPKPSLVVIDGTALIWGAAVKAKVETELGVTPVTLYGLHCASGLGMAYGVGCGESAMPWKAIREESKAKGEASIDTFYRWLENDVITHYPGMPPHYRYEWDPAQFFKRSPDIAKSFGQMIDHRDAMDGMVIGWPEELEPEARQVWLKCMPREGAVFLPVGPQLPPGYWAGGEMNMEDEYATGKSAQDIHAFLDRCVEEYGEKSVINISFGSALFPKESSHLVALFETLNSLSPPTPYLFACPNASLPEEVSTVIQKSGPRGMASEWVPQQSVLRHKAVGWALTHGGANSTSECIVNSVPMVIWPISAEQPWTAAYISLVQKAGFELTQIRTGYNIGRPLSRGGTVEGTDEAVRAEMDEVFRKVRGGEGQEIRKGMERLRDMVVTSRERGGSARAMSALGAA